MDAAHERLKELIEADGRFEFVELGKHPMQVAPGFGWVAPPRAPEVNLVYSALLRVHDKDGSMSADLLVPIAEDFLGDYGPVVTANLILEQVPADDVRMRVRNKATGRFRRFDHG